MVCGEFASWIGMVMVYKSWAVSCIEFTSEFIVMLLRR